MCTIVLFFFPSTNKMHMPLLIDVEVKQFFFSRGVRGKKKKCVDAIPSSLASRGATPIILCRCLERTNVYCYYKAAFVVIACAPCPLLLVSALLSFCAGLRGLVQPAASAAALWLEREGGRVLLSRTLCFIFIKWAAFDLLPLWRVTAWTAAPHCSWGNRALTPPLPQTRAHTHTTPNPQSLSPLFPLWHQLAMPPSTTRSPPSLTITATAPPILSPPRSNPQASAPAY